MIIRHRQKQSTGLFSSASLPPVRFPFAKKRDSEPLALLFLTESLRTQKIGRELVFSADLWYNGMGDENGRTEKTQDHSVEKCGL